MAAIRRDRLSTARRLPLAAVALLLAGCGGMRERIDRVVVTAIPKEVAACQALGPVSTYSRESTRDDGLDQLREQSLQRGGNTVLVGSYALSTTGSAYRCDPPLKQEGHYYRGGPLPDESPS